MNLLPTEDQDLIVQSISAFLAAEAPLDRLRPRHGQVGNTDHSLWPRLAELGVWGLSTPEDLGGVGLGVCEEYLLFREFGRHLLSLGALGLTLATRIAAAGGAHDELALLLTGEARVAIANPRGPTTLGPISSGDWHLIEAESPDFVVAWSAAGAALFRADAFKVTASPVAMDSHIILRRAVLDPAVPLVFLPRETDDIGLRALVLIAAYAVGIVEAAREASTTYAKVREQFGQPIGRFQAVKHRCANMAIRAEVAACQTTYAAVALQAGERDGAFHAIAAKLLATEAALRNAADNIQNHGAFGFTAEGDAHLFLKRAHTLDFLSGDLPHQRAALLREPPPCASMAEHHPELQGLASLEDAAA